MKKVLIFGSGAIGSVIGGFLALSGESITLYGRKDHIEAIRADGLQIKGIWGDHCVKNIKAEHEIGSLQGQGYDLILLTVRAYDLEQVLPDVKKIANATTILVSMQNGLGNIEKISRFFPKNNILGSRVIFGAKKVKAGTVEVTVYAEEVMLGPVQGTPTDAFEKLYTVAEDLAGRLSKAGVPSLPTREVEKYIWAKVLYNAALNPLSALLSATYGNLADNPHTRTMMKEIIQEIFSVAQAKQIPMFWDSPDGYWKKFIEQEVPATQAHRSSMLQAIEAGKPVEIDALNGAVVEMAREMAISVPVNDLLVRLIRAKQYHRVHFPI